MTPEKYDSLSPYEKADIIEEYKIYTNSWSDIEDYDEVQDTIDSGYASFYQLNGDLQTAIQSGDYDYLIIGESYASESDIVDGIIRAENGEMSDEELIEFVKEHKNTLMQLQGSWQRTVQSVLDYIGESYANEDYVVIRGDGTTHERHDDKFDALAQAELLGDGATVHKMDNSGNLGDQVTEADPDFDNDSDYQGYVNGVKVQPSQYTLSGWDNEKKERWSQRGDVDPIGEVDNDSTEDSRQSFKTKNDAAFAYGVVFRWDGQNWVDSRGNMLVKQKKNGTATESFDNDSTEDMCFNCKGRGWYMGDTLTGDYDEITCEVCNGTGKQ
jgi:hypothetical protein